MTNIRILSLISVVSIAPRLLWATTTASTSGVGCSASTTTFSNQHLLIDESNRFDKAPHAIISSIISNARRNPSYSLIIDVASSRMNDDGALSLLQALLAHLQSKIIGTDQSDMNETLLVKLSIAMNNLTPLGVSNLIDLLAKKVDEQNDMNSAKYEVKSIPEGLRSESKIEHILANETHPDEPEDHSLDTTPHNIIKESAIMIEELDLSYNDIGGHGSHAHNVQLLDSIRSLCERGNGGGVAAAFIPRVLTLENCGIGPAFCRSVGRGVLNAFESNRAKEVNLEYRPSVLHFGGNNAIGDAGAVALAAALRMAKGHNHHVLEELDLSSCNIGDAGVEALALAVASNPDCLRRLDLSNNKISDAGATSLGKALVDANRVSDVIFENIILDNNVGISDGGAAALAEAWAYGAVKSISLRSCSVQAQGASAFGRALVSLANRNNQCHHFFLDLSGNHFGTLKKAKKGGAAGRLRDTANTNIRFIGKQLKGAAKRFTSETMGITVDSDDDEEIMGGLLEDVEEEIDNKLLSCGGLAFAGELINSARTKVAVSRVKISVGMRQCSLDDGAVDALSASVVGAGNYELSIDVSMNSAEDSIVHDLMDAKQDSEVLAKMAKRHADFMDRVANARQRQSASESGIIFGSFFDDEELSDVGI